MSGIEMLLTMCASNLTDQRAFSHDLDQRFTLVTLLVHVADVPGCVVPFQRYGYGVVDSLEPLETLGVSTSSLSLTYEG